MARLFEDFDEDRHGRLDVERRSSYSVEVFYTPPMGKLKQYGLNTGSSTGWRVNMLSIDIKNQNFTIFPVYTIRRSEEFLKQKYKQIKRIALIGFDSLMVMPSTQEEVMEVLEELPSAFIKDYDYGLGLAKPYRFIVDAVEKLSSCTEIMISKEGETSIDVKQNSFHISFDDFESARKSINNIHDIALTAAQCVKEGTIHNLLAERVGQSKISVSTGRHPLRKKITSVCQGEESLSGENQEMILDVLTKNTKSIVESRPEKISKLRNDIELASLEILITRYEEMIGKKPDERCWQAFFNENPFILSLAFNYPIIKIQDQASVGGRRISGGGDTIADFIVKNSMSNNTSIIEIKTPQTKLLNKAPFRDGVYAPSGDLTGAINQVLDQKYQFERHITQIKENSSIDDIHSYSVHCCLIVGTMPSDEQIRKSFEQFRGNSKNVEIVTFDELLIKLKEFLEFLTSAESDLAPRLQSV